MTSSRRLGFGAAAIAVLLGLTAACGSGGSGENEGSAGTEGKGSSKAQQAEIGVLPAEGTSGYDFLVGVGDEITAQNPDFTYEYTFVNSKIRPMIEQRWRAGSPPDTDYFVFNAQVPSTHAFVDNLLELDPYLDAEMDGGGTWRENFLDATESVTTLDGKTYGVVTDTHVIGLFYNKKMFTEMGLTPPATWDDLLEVSAKLKSNGVDPIAVTGMYEPYMGFWTDSMFQREVGYEKSREAVFSGDFSDPGFLKAAEKIQELRDQGSFLNGFEGIDFTAVQMEFFQGNAGMILMGTWLASEMQDAIPEDFELGVVAFPEVPGGAGDQKAELSHSNVAVINKESKNIEASLEYLQKFTSPETQTKRASDQGAVSAVKDVPAPPAIDGLDEILANATDLNVRYFGLEFVPDRNTAYYHEVAKFLFGNYDAAEFIESISTAMTKAN